MPRLNHRPRADIRDRPGRIKLLVRRQRWLLRPAPWLAGMLACAVAILWLAHAIGPSGSFANWREGVAGATASLGFTLKDVIIEGRANTPEPLLRAAIGAGRGDPILGFSVAGAQQRIESLAWVEHASVERRLPDTIVVRLTERRPFAVWQNQGKFALIDRDGQVVGHQNLAAFRQLPLVVGAGAPAAAAALLDLLQARPGLAGRVLAAVRVGERRWNLKLKSGTDVLLPEGQEAPALDRLIELQDSVALLDRPLRVVDLRLSDRLVVQPLAAPSTPVPPVPPVPPRRPT